MNFKKRDNRMVYTPMVDLFVADNNSALRTTSTLVGTGTALNLSDGQLGVVSRDVSSAVANGAYVDATNSDPASVDTIQVVRGTPNSANLANVSAFNVNDKAFLGSNQLRATNLVSVTGRKFFPGQRQIAFYTGVSTPTAGESYVMGVTLENDKRDLEFGLMKRDQVVATVNIPEVLPTNGVDFALQVLADKLNEQSLSVKGNRPFIVLGVKVSGGSGTAISGLSLNDSVDFITRGTTTYSFNVDMKLFQSLSGLVGTGDALENATIEVINADNAGGASTVDGLIVVGLDEPFAFAFDETHNVTTRVSMFSDLIETTNEVLVGAVDAKGSGRAWKKVWETRVMPYIYSLQNKNMGHYPIFEKIPSYINEDGLYNANIVEYFDTEVTLTTEKLTPKKLIILTPVTLELADSGDTTVAGGAYEVTGAVDTMLTSLNATLGKWIRLSGEDFSNVQFLEDSSSTTPFV